ncbi:prepilin-type N-terminal cleavage/methylation domain-containing protein [Vibrio hepatarius]|jgi:MSHA pilin protein MshB|uniref:MSHA biogenesis protein MshB n=1 Tax=Vibrio hepatarius TaxID=171383 RepID=A0A0M0HVN4_9VIBR|nr:prepilin-type N-terminal cleavage/methylation domain-containing protein [Vibrio hepatarius]KOO06146.1 MSHA biogenesis protein MshB [Vibrio hepatarius]NOI15713.1 prepilin-type N-terminal cleavage/methylation domain-containing protein [Vibrio hepatarius]
MLRKQTGFSLVELVVVIVVVGLLAVAALPRFLDVTDEAKKASIEGVAGGFATGVLSARAQWEAEARPSVTLNGEKYNTVDYDGVDFWLTRSKDSSDSDTGFRDGYPYALNEDNTSYPTSLTDQACIDLMDNLLQNPPSVDTVANAANNKNVKYSAQANTGASTCTYVQQEGGSKHQFVYEIETGRVTVTLQ